MTLFFSHPLTRHVQKSWDLSRELSKIKPSSVYRHRSTCSPTRHAWSCWLHRVACRFPITRCLHSAGRKRWNAFPASISRRLSSFSWWLRRSCAQSQPTRASQQITKISMICKSINVTDDLTLILISICHCSLSLSMWLSTDCYGWSRKAAKRVNILNVAREVSFERVRIVVSGNSYARTHTELHQVKSTTRKTTN